MGSGSLGCLPLPDVVAGDGRPVVVGHVGAGSGVQARPRNASRRTTEQVAPVFGGGGQVALDRVPGFGGLDAGEPPGDFDLGLGGAEVAFGLVGRGRHA